MEIEAETLADWRGQGLPHVLVDVREPWETEICSIGDSRNIPLAELAESLDMIPSEGPVVVVCHHGVRSMEATAWLRSAGFAGAVNLRGGIEMWARRVDPTMRRY